jgi:branched-subunit amino acid ABC-type transport system permease component
MDTFLLTVGLGLSTAAILALSAVAFTLEFAVSNVANLAHGEMLTVGAYAAYVGARVSHDNVAVATVSAIAAGAATGWALNFALIERFRGQHVISTFIATLGASLILQNLLVMGFGAANVSYSFPQGALHHVGPFLWTTSDLAVIMSALLMAGLIYLLLQRTKLGKALRAVSQNRELAQVSGIPARRVVAQTWALAGGIAGFAGFVLAETIGTFSPTLGNSFLLLTIAATVAGGLGRPYATLGGALVVGIILQVAGAYTSAAYELVFAFLVLVVLLIFLPNGIFIRGGAKAVRV